MIFWQMGFRDDSAGKELACSAEDAGDVSSISLSVRSPGEGNGNPLQYSCLKNPMDRGAWKTYSPKSHKESDMTERLLCIADLQCCVSFRCDSVIQSYMYTTVPSCVSFQP